LLRSEDGFVIAIVAVLVFSFIVLGGLAVEAGFWYAVKRQDQSAADAAALAAAFEYAGGIETGLQTGPTDAPGAAISAASSNGFSAVPTVTPSCPSNPCPVQGTVQVVLADQMNTLLGAAILGSTVTIATAATTHYQPLTTIRNGTPVSVGQSCLIALGILTITGQNGVPPFSMPNCIILDELSTNDHSIVINGVSGSWSLAALVTAGGIFTDGSPLPQKTFTQFPLAPMLAPTNPYPYGNVTASPPPGNCSPNSNNPQPGILYCSLTFTGAVNVVLPAGLYYTGNLSITALSNGASIIGTGVTIVLTNVSQNSPGAIDIEPWTGTCNTTTVSLAAPGPGLGLLPPSATASQGLLIFQDPTAVVNPTITIGASDPSCGTATVTLTGAIVTPATSPTVAGYPVAGVQSCTEFIAASFTFTGNPQLDDSGCNPPSAAAGGIGRFDGSGFTGITIDQTNPVEQVFVSQ
jgi:hypothetical protein